MGHSSLLGTDLAPLEPAGRDTAALGPGDNSDSGSDMAGLDEELDDGDPSVPVDVALREDNQRAGMSPDALGGSASDASGTGERRSAGGDAGRREAADISTDHVFTPGEAGDPDAEDDGDEDEDPDLAFVDQAEAGDVLDEEDDATREDEEGALGDEAASGTAPSGVLSSGPQPPGRPNPEPDVPDPVAPQDEEDIPSDDDDDEQRAPGRS